jgi:hypothetical protein
LVPPTGADNKLKAWASRLRDEDERWQRLSQSGVRLFMDLAIDQGVSFAFETVFSHLERQPDGTIRSKADVIRALQGHSYYEVLLFVGLASAALSHLASFNQKGAHVTSHCCSTTAGASSRLSLL